jgi:hypothetical protein
MFAPPEQRVADESLFPPAAAPAALPDMGTLRDHPNAGGLADEAFPHVANGSIFKNPGTVQGNGWTQAPGGDHTYDEYNKLAGLFTHVDQHGQGDAPNAMTNTEMMAMVGLYRNIDKGLGDLTINTSDIKDPDQAAAVHGKFMENIAALMQTGPGREILLKLANNEQTVDGKKVHRKTTLRAYHKDENHDDRNDDWDAPLASDNAEVIPPRKGDEHDTGMQMEYGNLVPGRGTDALVLLNPLGILPEGIRNDVALMHELNHALHTTSGTNDPMGVNKDPGAAGTDVNCNVPESEYQAVGLGMHQNDKWTVNAYRDARRQMVDKHAVGQILGDNYMTKRDAYTDGFACSNRA